MVYNFIGSDVILFESFLLSSTMTWSPIHFLHSEGRGHCYKKLKKHINTLQALISKSLKSLFSPCSEFIADQSTNYPSILTITPNTL